MIRAAPGHLEPSRVQYCDEAYHAPIDLRYGTLVFLLLGEQSEGDQGFKESAEASSHYQPKFTFHITKPRRAKRDRFLKQAGPTLWFRKARDLRDIVT
jgi:hypothetical protein